MLHFPPIRRKPFGLPHIRPHNADLLSGIHGQRNFDWLLIESGIDPPVWDWGDPSAAQHRRFQHARRRRDASGRMVAWLGAHDPLFAATINMLFDVTESWPPRVEHVFWKTINGKPIRFLDVYLEVRDIVDAVVEERAGQG